MSSAADTDRKTVCPLLVVTASNCAMRAEVQVFCLQVAREAAKFYYFYCKQKKRQRLCSYLVLYL